MELRCRARKIAREGDAGEGRVEEKQAGGGNGAQAADGGGEGDHHAELGDDQAEEDDLVAEDQLAAWSGSRR